MDTPNAYGPHRPWTGALVRDALRLGLLDDDRRAEQVPLPEGGGTLAVSSILG